MGLCGLKQLTLLPGGDSLLLEFRVSEVAGEAAQWGETTDHGSTVGTGRRDPLMAGHWQGLGQDAPARLHAPRGWAVEPCREGLERGWRGAGLLLELGLVGELRAPVEQGF